VLPYLNYSHSSALISCARLESAVIISDIDLFKDYFDDYDLIFPSGDSKSLASLLDKAALMPIEEVRIRARLLKCSVERHDEELIEKLARAYGD
jgi:hypothetical protein